MDSNTNNICYILDNFQCLLPDTEITMGDGSKKAIEDIKEHDSVTVAAGKGAVTSAPVESVSKRKHQGKIFNITTSSGFKIKGTSNHITFARYTPKEEEKFYYVYLMYKKSRGYRIGRSSNVRTTNGKIVNGFRCRLSQETGDKLWILDTCKDLKESMYLETYYAYKYGIPQYVFTNKNETQLLSDEMIIKLYSELNTEESAKKLLEDKHMFIDHADFIPQANTAIGKAATDNRKKLSFCMFGGSEINPQGMTKHKLTANTISEEYNEVLNKYMKTYKVKNKKTVYYNLSKVVNDYDLLWECAQDIYEDMIEDDHNFDVDYEAKLLKDDKFSFTPLSHLKLGIEVCVLNESGELIEDVVTDIQVEDYDGYVHDINIKDYRNYIANDIVMHNSIYSFRGASLDAVLSIPDLHPELKQFKLRRNYRSTQTIVNAAESMMSKIPSKLERSIHSENEVGAKVAYIESYNPEKEAETIVKMIMGLKQKTDCNYSDIAILYRMNYLSRAIEDYLLVANIPYDIRGSVSFYCRKEIKDVLSIIKLIYNPYDFESFKRGVSIPKRGVGDVNLEKIYDYAMQDPNKPIDFIQVAKDNPLTGKAKKGLKEFSDLIEELKEESLVLSPKDLINCTMNKMKYYDYLDSTEKDMNLLMDRKQNLEELLALADKFPNLEELMLSVSLATNEDVEGEKIDRVQLGSMHSSKGLEFINVFIINCNEGCIPFYKAVEEGNTDEERRLFYVGMTRAKENLFLTRPQIIYNRGQRMQAKETRFIKEINPKYIRRM